MITDTPDEETLENWLHEASRPFTVTPWQVALVWHYNLTRCKSCKKYHPKKTCSEFIKDLGTAIAMLNLSVGLVPVPKNGSRKA